MRSARNILTITAPVASVMAGCVATFTASGDALNVRNFSFESPVIDTSYLPVSLTADNWMLNGYGDVANIPGFGTVAAGVGIFPNPAAGQPGRLNGIDGNQATYIFSNVGNEISQGLVNAGNTNTATTFAAGLQYSLTMSLADAQAMPPVDDLLLIGLYYIDAGGVRRQALSKTIRSGDLSQTDFQDITAASGIFAAGDSAIGRQIFVHMTSLSNGGGEFDIDNVRLNALAVTDIILPFGQTLDLAGSSKMALSISDGGNTGGGKVTNNGGGAVTLNFLPNAAKTFSGVIQNSDSGGGTLAITLNGSGTQTLTGHLAYTGPTIVSAGTLVLAPATGSASIGGLTVNGGIVRISGSARVSLASPLAITDGGLLDVGGGMMTVNFGVGNPSPAADIKALIKSGYNGGGQTAWQGTGVTSTSIATHPRTAIGYVDANDPSPTNSAAPGTFKFGYVLAGDTGLRGRVGLEDYNILAANFNTAGGWGRGDFTYDDLVGLEDYNLLAANFNVHTPAAVQHATKVLAAVTLTGQTGPAFFDPGSGKVALEADPNTGKLYLVGHDAHISSYEIDSAAGKLTNTTARGSVPGYNTLASQSQAGIPGSALGANEPFWNVISQLAGGFIAEGVTTGQSLQFDVIGPGLTAFDLNVSGKSAWTAGTDISDLFFKYGDGTGNTLTPAVIALPEPAMLSMVGLSMIGLMARRRRKSEPQALAPGHVTRR